MPNAPADQRISEVYGLDLDKRIAAAAATEAETRLRAMQKRLLLAVQNERRSAEAALELAVQRSTEMDRMKQAATEGELDVLKAQIEVLSRKQDVERLRERLTALQKGGPVAESGR